MLLGAAELVHHCEGTQGCEAGGWHQIPQWVRHSGRFFFKKKIGGAGNITTIITIVITVCLLLLLLIIIMILLIIITIYTYIYIYYVEKYCGEFSSEPGSWFSGYRSLRPWPQVAPRSKDTDRTRELKLAAETEASGRGSLRAGWF